ncbi:hypothetical protein DL89DRAFT_222500 [Linderina pennispora]|uniref:Tubulin-folding cofactor D ARM repeats domain-containing protein n=1 Tax=Linderina pennispora TaxID=61395 RepID=A0A1Y1WBD2_9FUNG|nr:uncharacterized protein DL89DRAFT_222500 [Linderina pennispora]ORX70849.1 hypothetical protein DL89DRAFT_222500 [Linderina pennispora]
MSEILGRYQEQPTCLDPHLERIISQLMSLAQRYVYAFHDSLSAGSADAVSAQRMGGIFGLVYLLCKVRGYKVVLRFFPHEVADIEPVFAALWYHTAKPDGKSWTTRYVLLIWLSLRLIRHVDCLMDILHSDAFEQHALTRKLIAKDCPATGTCVPARRIWCSDHWSGTHRQSLPGPADGDSAGDIDEEECDVEIPEQVETFVGILLQKLHDKDTIVRWSAAKGIGRISARLPPALAREIASAVADVMTEETLVQDDGTIDVSMTSEYSWHGALLCLAELARRGLLSSQLLREAMPWVIKGLTYEIQRGDYSVGSNVRDAACYVMWSFARIHGQESRAVFADLQLKMATVLVSVAVFDRETNVRRAASAAFQEHVGRHSSFPHGISVLQLADFFAVGNMRNAFTDASRRIAEYVECTPASPQSAETTAILEVYGHSDAICVI